MSDQLPPLPEPDTHCFDEDTGRDCWSYSADQLRAYAAAAVAAERENWRDKVDVLLLYGGSDGRRDWVSAGAWLYPGDVLAVVSGFQSA
jgi:hypothetical protein